MEPKAILGDSRNQVNLEAKAILGDS
jgi:hypothetical protein